jgi:hypothetical protein
MYSWLLPAFNRTLSRMPEKFWNSTKVWHGSPGSYPGQNLQVLKKNGHDRTHPGHVQRVQVLSAGLSAGTCGYLQVVSKKNIYGE